jgi:hypothetical protein
VLRRLRYFFYPKATHTSETSVYNNSHGGTFQRTIFFTVSAVKTLSPKNNLFRSVNCFRELANSAELQRCADLRAVIEPRLYRAERAKTRPLSCPVDLAMPPTCVWYALKCHYSALV